ncbi:hypothetical protein E4U54_005361 [Claviceps lovelessii]|nr:hypothetical protein E4U54_005361 [Claviceps lovelessii]
MADTMAVLVSAQANDAGVPRAALPRHGASERWTQHSTFSMEASVHASAFKLTCKYRGLVARHPESHLTASHRIEWRAPDTIRPCPACPALPALPCIALHCLALHCILKLQVPVVKASFLSPYVEMSANGPSCNPVQQTAAHRRCPADGNGARAILYIAPPALGAAGPATGDRARLLRRSSPIC